MVATRPPSDHGQGSLQIRLEIVDVLIAQDHNYRFHQMADFSPLVEAADGSSCLIFAAIQSMVSDTVEAGTENIDMCRGTACNYWA